MRRSTPAIPEAALGFARSATDRRRRSADAKAIRLASAAQSAKIPGGGVSSAAMPSAVIGWCDGAVTATTLDRDMLHRLLT
jgi:hypothetical protein